MAIYSVGPVDNLSAGTLRSSSVNLRIANTTAAGLTPITVNVYSATAVPANGSTQTAETLYFTTTFSLNAANAVQAINIPTTVPSYEIRVSSPLAAGFINDISLYAQGLSAGNAVIGQEFPFGDLQIVTTV
jgi:hypothetical protein